MQNVFLACHLHTTRGEEGRETTFRNQKLTQNHYTSKDQAVLLEPRLCQQSCKIHSTPYQFPGDVEQSVFQGHRSLGHTQAYNCHLDVT